jgi:hypothetical protein
MHLLGLVMLGIKNPCSQLMHLQKVQAVKQYPNMPYKAKSNWKNKTVTERVDLKHRKRRIYFSRLY